MPHTQGSGPSSFIDLVGRGSLVHHLFEVVNRLGMSGDFRNHGGGSQLELFLRHEERLRREIVKRGAARGHWRWAAPG